MIESSSNQERWMTVLVDRWEWKSWGDELRRGSRTRRPACVWDVPTVSPCSIVVTTAEPVDWWDATISLTPLCPPNLSWSQWATLTFDLAFRWAKVRSKSRLKSKSKVISLSESLRPNLLSKYRLRPKLSWTLVWVRTLAFSLRFRSAKGSVNS